MCCRQRGRSERLYWLRGSMSRFDELGVYGLGIGMENVQQPAHRTARAAGSSQQAIDTHLIS